jgi:uncharacterized protein
MRVPHDNEAQPACKAPMTVEELLDVFTFAEDLPEAALREATARRAELVEPFLAEIERWIADTEAEPEKPSPLFYIVHLLGAWREKRAFEPICRMLRADPDRLGWELGDALTSTIPRILTTLCDGDWGPLRQVIEDDAADEFARSTLLDTLLAFVEVGKASREEVASYLAGLPTRVDAPSLHALWTTWAWLVADLRATELYQSVEEAFALGHIDSDILTLDEFKAGLQQEKPRSSDFAEPFGTDVVEELFATFDFDGDEDEASVPIVNPYRHVGRNDPCPCGSGKKFKRCHGA